MVSEPPPLVWVLHSDPVLREARVAMARQMGAIAAPMDSAARALERLNHGGDFIPDLILFDDAVGDMAPGEFAAALADLAPPVIYIVTSSETAEALTSPPLRPGQDAVFQRPVAAREVIEAICLVLRRSAEETKVLHAEGLELDLIRRTLAYRGRNIHLTRLECGFMEYVMRRSGRVVSSDELLERVWGFEPGTGAPEVVRAHVRNLRRKLELLGAPRDLIWTLPGRGYQIRDALDTQPIAALRPFVNTTAPGQRNPATGRRSETG